MWCKMHIDGECKEFLGAETEGRYRRLRLALLEARTRNPTPFVSLRFDRKDKRWKCRLVEELSYLRAGYSHLRGV